MGLQSNLYNSTTPATKQICSSYRNRELLEFELTVGLFKNYLLSRVDCGRFKCSTSGKVILRTTWNYITLLRRCFRITHKHIFVGMIPGAHTVRYPVWNVLIWRECLYETVWGWSSFWKVLRISITNILYIYICEFL